MINVASNGAATADPWQSASASSDGSSVRLSDACALLAVLVRSQGASQDGSKTEIQLDAKKLEELKKQLADAIQHAKEASEHSGFFGFLGDIFGGDIAQLAGAVAAIAAVVATGGAATPLLLVAVSEALQVGAKVGAELGLDPKLCMALSIASVAVGFCTGTGTAQAASALADGARDVGLGAKLLQGSATVAGGALNYTAAHYHAKDLDYQADAAGYQARNQATSLDMDDAFALLQRALRTEQHETSTASQVIKDNSDANTALSNRI